MESVYTHTTPSANIPRDIAKTKKSKIYDDTT